MTRDLTETPAENIAGVMRQLDLKITYVRTESLVAHGRRARTHSKAQIKAIAASVSEFGFIIPVIVDETGKVLAGNGAVEAALLLGLQTVPAVKVSHLSPLQKRAFVIAHNRLAEMGGWDPETLAIELEELRSLDLTFDIAATGFTNAQIDALQVTGGNDDSQADKIPNAGTVPVSQLGDLWLLGDHRLICGDATDKDVAARLLGDEKVRTIFTDPPYNLKVDGEVIRSKGHGEFVMGSGEMSDEQFTSFLSQVWAVAESVLVPGGLAYMAMDWRHIGHMHSAMGGKGLDLLNLIVWNKTTFGMGGFYRSQHELVFLTKKRGAPHTNQIGFGANGRSRSNVWTYPGAQGFGSAKASLRELHPTVKPMAMVRDAILDSTDRDEIVLDLFSGSGTTLIAAEVSRRKGRAIELDPIYVDTGVIRWEGFTGKEAVLAETGETFAQVRARRASVLSSKRPSHGPSVVAPGARDAAPGHLTATEGV